jgi:hypothetical protein
MHLTPVGRVTPAEVRVPMKADSRVAALHDRESAAKSAPQSFFAMGCAKVAAQELRRQGDFFLSVFCRHNELPQTSTSAEACALRNAFDRS